MALSFVDRLLTIVVTATVTSAAWVVLGSSYLDGTAAPEGPAAGPVATASPPQVAQPELPPPSGGRLSIPVEGVAAAQLSDTFDQRRGSDRRHEALDIMAPAGTPVLAAAPGKVEKLFRSDAGGNTVYVRSPDGTMLYYYAHLAAYAPGLREGQSVEQGARLGTVGATGNADPAAPHLHFAVMRTTPGAEWWEPATALDPYPLMTAR